MRGAVRFVVELLGAGFLAVFALRAASASLSEAPVELQPREQAEGEGSPEKTDVGELSHRDRVGTSAQ